MSNIVSVLEGDTCTLVEQFVDMFEDPLVLANTEAGPIVHVYDDERDLILEQVAVPDHKGQPGDWSVDVTIPQIGLSEKKQFTVVWTFKTSDNEVHRSRQALFVEPDDESRESDIIVVVGRDKIMQVALPVDFTPNVPEIPGDPSTNTPASKGIPGDTLRFSLFRNNIALFGEEGLVYGEPNSGVKLTQHIGKTVATLPAVVGKAKLEPLILMVDYSKPGMIIPTTLTYKVWPITPQVLIAASQMEDFINKARIQNVIPELDYTQPDLIQYLHRGLALLNSFPPHTTNFTGTNMQGILLDAWLQCSSYYALASQLQAEGAMAFDFSGQTVSLNIDRTPAIESALGRVETALDQNVKPLKKLLAKAGVLDGDGSAGGQMINGAHHLGTLGVMNAPTTRLPHAGHKGSWFRPFY